MLKMLDDIWYGRLLLWQAFVYVWLPIFFGQYFLTNVYDVTQLSQHTVFLWAGVTVLVDGYVCVGLWRSARNVQGRGWKLAGKVLALASALPVLLLIVSSFITTSVSAYMQYRNYQTNKQLDQLQHEITRMGEGDSIPLPPHTVKLNVSPTGFYIK